MFDDHIHSTMASRLKKLPFTLLLCLFVVTIVQSKLQVPFQDFATPGPTISKKVYYLEESCSICEKFRPDFTKIKLPEEETKSVESESIENDTTEKSKSLKRVPRSLDSKSEKPEITFLSYDQDSKQDSDLQNNGTWSWRTAFRRIKAKWIERFQNKTARKVENKITADLKVQKTPEGNEEKKVIIEFKKKIQNLTLLNTETAVPAMIQDSSKSDKVLVKREIRQIFLDPVRQPSIVIRKRRSIKDDEAEQDDEKKDRNQTTLDNETLKKETNRTYEKCRLLIRLKADSNLSEIENVTENALIEDSEVIITTIAPNILSDSKSPVETLKAPNDSTEQMENSKINSEEPAVGTVDDAKDFTKKPDGTAIKPKSSPQTVEKIEKVSLKSEEISIKPEESSKKIAQTVEEPKDVLQKPDKSAPKIKQSIQEISVKPESPPEKVTETVEEHKDVLQKPNESLMNQVKSQPKMKGDEKEHEDIVRNSKGSLSKLQEPAQKIKEPAEKISVKPENPPENIVEERKDTLLEPEGSMAEQKKSNPEMKGDDKEPKNASEKPKETSQELEEKSTTERPTETEKKSISKEQSASQITKTSSEVPSSDKNEKAKEENPEAEETKKEEPKTEEPKKEKSESGFIINIRTFVNSIVDTIESDYNRTKKIEEKVNPFWKNIKIFTSDPKMTELWFEGKKVDKKETGSRTKRSVNDPFIDMIDMDDIVQLLTQNGTVDLDIVNEKWILLERKVFFDDPDEDEDQELIINLFFKPKDEEQFDEQLSSKSVPQNKKRHQCPYGTFDCRSDGSLCIPKSLKCNGEDNCGNGRDETTNCGSSFNLFYVYSDPDSSVNSRDLLDSNTQGMIWFAIRILFILFATCLFLYILLLLCRMCDRLRNDPGPMVILPKGNYISISGENIEHKKRSKYGTAGTNLNSRGSKIREYIYVNNNYGQPQGAALVSNDIFAKPRSHKRDYTNNRHNSTTSPEGTDDEYPPLYEDFVKNYGGTKK